VRGFYADESGWVALLIVFLPAFNMALVKLDGAGNQVLYKTIEDDPYPLDPGTYSR